MSLEPDPADVTVVCRDAIHQGGRAGRHGVLRDRRQSWSIRSDRDRHCGWRRNRQVQVEIVFDVLTGQGTADRDLWRRDRRGNLLVLGLRWGAEAAWDRSDSDVCRARTHRREGGSHDRNPSVEDEGRRIECSHRYRGTCDGHAHRSHTRRDAEAVGIDGQVWIEGHRAEPRTLVVAAKVVVGKLLL